MSRLVRSLAICFKSTGCLVAPSGRVGFSDSRYKGFDVAKDRLELADVLNVRCSSESVCSLVVVARLKSEGDDMTVGWSRSSSEGGLYVVEVHLRITSCGVKSSFPYSTSRGTILIASGSSPFVQDGMMGLIPARQIVPAGSTAFSL
jgi:hypothetical protein